VAEGDASGVYPTGGCIDTRKLKTGEVFFALSGEHTDGHRFVGAALEKGAAAAVVSRAWYREVEDRPRGALVLSDDPGLAMGDLARVYRRRFEIPVVGITGSTGKTTTKDMAAAVLGTRYRVLATEGNLNNHLGVPLTLFRLSSQHEVAVIEMGISEEGDLRDLCEIVDPTIGVITNIGPTHLEFLGSVEGVAKAKGELLEYLDESSMAILNLDDLWTSKERARLKGRLLDFGIEKICQFRGEGLILDQEGCGHFSLQGHSFHLAVPGRHNVYNALAAAAVGAALEVPIADSASVLGAFRPLRLRSQILERGGIRLFNDAYNANPVSVRSAIETLLRVSVDRGGRRVAVLGDMLELGSVAPDAHREIGRTAAERGADALFAFGELASEVATGGVEAGLPPERSRAFTSRTALVAALRGFLQPHDLVLLKGSRGLAMEKVGAALGFEPPPPPERRTQS
jgi:UDP-N-acetylmuramoyl-tripeptide--D-alanyl-D-alanine ligase